MNKRVIITGILILAIAIVGKLLFVIGKNIKIDDFHKAAVIFLIDSSISNQDMLPEEIKYIKSLCAILDPEDAIKILKVSSSSYLIFEGSPGDSSGISKSFKEYTKNDNKNSAAYGEALKKAFNHTLTMKKEGYVPAVVVIGNLANEGEISKQINWQTLPENIQKVKNYIPELAMMFVFAPPEKLDMVKTKLNPIFGEKKLIVANKANISKANRRFLEAIGR